MYSAARTNPQATVVTEVIWGDSEQATQAGPVGFCYGKFCGEKELASFVKGLGAWSQCGHEFFSP
jgi:hypothetical protein